MYSTLKPDIFNSDQGSKHAAKEHLEIFKQHNISISMDTKGRSVGNMWVRSLCNGLLKRIHSSIGYRTPDEVYCEAIKNKGYENSKLLPTVA